MSIDEEDDQLMRRIDQLLTSSDRQDLWRGLEMVDSRYRREVCGYVRRWSKRHDLRLDAADLPVIWQEVLISLARKAERGDYEARGHHLAFLLWVAKRRAVDLMRSRGTHQEGWIDHSIPIEKVAAIRFDNPHDIDELIAAIFRGFARLTEVESVVLRCRYRESIDAHPPTLAELTELVNGELTGAHSAAAVKAALQRARNKMREHLRWEGY